MPQNAVNGRIKLAITEPLVASGWFRGLGVFAYVLNFIFTPLKPFFHDSCYSFKARNGADVLQVLCSSFYEGAPRYD